ncbi:unnamed protein product [Peniophora sp. CBMAI 1063]|nr:unnamed protein product [Peniophora sp. CBMAI 1063]
MAPKNGNGAAPSNSRELVRTGPKEVQIKHHPKGKSIRDADGNLPTTARALVLRNGKHGAMGAGELVLTKHIAGREKLDLLGEDLATRFEKADKELMRPFNLELAMRIADSQFNMYLDDVLDLKTPERFYTSMVREMKSRLPESKQDPNMLQDHDKITDALASKIHNSFMLASIWRIIRDRTEYLDNVGLHDDNVRMQLLKNEELRIDYLVLYNIVSRLTDALQVRFAQAASRSAHFSEYLDAVNATKNGDNPTAAFNWQSLKKSYKNFVDSIVIELCLPGTTYPKYVLTALLEEAIQESPKEAKRFPQAMFDVLGDFSQAVLLLEILEAPLLALGRDGKKYRSMDPEMPEEFAQWEDHQPFSEHVLNIICDTYADNLIVPLEKAQRKHTVDVLWKQIDHITEENYGVTFWQLWWLEDVSRRISHWGLEANPQKGALVKGSKGGKKGKSKPLALTNGEESDNDSMPSLETVSDTSEEEWEESSSEEDSDEEEDEEDSDYSDYDSDEEEMRHMFREAMDAAHENPDFFDPTKELDEGITAEERKGNPFMKLLGNLRGRMFSTNSTLKTTEKKVPYVRTKQGPKPMPPKPGTFKPPGFTGKTQAPPKPTATGTKAHKVTVEEVEDEGDGMDSASKKKKKKKKKKKPTTTESTRPVTPPPTTTSAPTTPKKEVPKSPPPVPKSPPAAPKYPGVSDNQWAHMSTTSLSGSTAESAHSYLQREGTTEKIKVKTRKEVADEQPEEKQGFFSKLKSRFAGSKKETKDRKEEVDDNHRLEKSFAALGKKAALHMSYVLQSKETVKIVPLRWTDFCKMMAEMGFTMDASTAGSSVRFDPPDGTTRSISFHRPHPEQHIEPVTLRLWGKKLKEYYGWDEEIFLKSAKNLPK